MATYYNNAIAEKLGQEKLAVGWPWRLFVFSGLAMTAAAVVYVGLAFGYRQLLEQQLQRVETEMDELAQSIPQEQQEGLLRFYSQLANLQVLLRNHLMSSQLFPFLERNTNQTVAYTTLDFKASDRRAALEGSAPSYQALSQQLEAFSRTPQVENVVVNDSYAAEGRVFFRLTAIISGDTLRYPRQ